jgi:ubiquinone/menaquinone biosynthesis C-methylase UbiE
MLIVARAAGEREGLTIEWREGRAEELPFQDGSFDLVLCQFGLMFFADRQAGLTEIHRVLANRGRLLLNGWDSLDRHPFYEKLHGVIQERVGVSALQDIAWRPDQASRTAHGCWFSECRNRSRFNERTLPES